MDLDLKALKIKLQEYDSTVPRCKKQIEDVRYYAPDYMDVSDPEFDNYKVVYYQPCSRIEGHDGDCRNGRPVLGWPGFKVLSELIRRSEELEEIHESRV